MTSAEVQYSVYRHLTRALWPNSDDGEVLFMVYGMTCYYDASSKEEVLDRPLVVAGIAATEAKWTQFEGRWAAILAEKNIEYFDTAACSGWFGDYKAWNRDESIRGPFLDRLAGVIADTASHFAYAWMVPIDWHTVNREYVLGRDLKAASPYAMATIYGAELLHKVLRTSPFLTPGGRAIHVVEYGDDGQGRLRHLADRGEIPLSFQRKWDKETGAKVHAFAACDLIAHYIRRAIEKHLAGKTRWKEMPGALAKLMTVAQPYEIQLDADLLRWVCERFPEDFPKRESQP